MRLLNLKSTVRHVCKPDLQADGKPKKDATVFHLRVLTASEKGAIADSIVDLSSFKVGQKEDGTPDVNVGDMGISMTGQMHKRLRLSIIGWDNLMDAEGNAVEWRGEDFRMGSVKVEGLALDLLEAFPDVYLKELDRKAQVISGLTAEQGN